MCGRGGDADHKLLSVRVQELCKNFATGKILAQFLCKLFFLCKSCTFLLFYCKWANRLNDRIKPKFYSAYAERCLSYSNSLSLHHSLVLSQMNEHTMVYSSPSGSPLNLVTGNIRFINIFARDHP